MAMSAEPRGGRCLIALLLPALIALTALAILVAQAVALLRGWDPGVRETPPTFSSPGPTVVQLERLQQLVSSRVHVADILVGESRWLEGSWIIQGDALLAVDMSKAEIKDRDEKARTAAIVLPHPAVLSARVNHERSQQWDIKSRSWIPLAGLLLGDRRAIEQQAMRRGPAARGAGRRHGRQQGSGAAGRRGHALRVLSRRRLAGLGPLEVTTPHGDTITDRQIWQFESKAQAEQFAAFWRRRQCNRAVASARLPARFRTSCPAFSCRNGQRVGITLFHNQLPAQPIHIDRDSPEPGSSNAELHRGKGDRASVTLEVWRETPRYDSTQHRAGRSVKPTADEGDDMATIGEMTLEDAAREAAGNWRSWTCFVWDREREIDDAENWSIIYTHNRDSGLLAQSNAAAIADVLMPFSETENPDVVFESHAHWAVGHVDGFSIRVYRDGEITEAFRTYHGLMEQLDGYPVLDEADYSSREYEAALENIEDAAWRLQVHLRLD